MVECSWDYANNLTTDSYQVLLPSGDIQVTTSPTYSTTDAESGQYCIKIKVVRQDGRYPATDWSKEGCA